MADQRDIDVNQIFKKLRQNGLHHGARANRLYIYGRELIDLLIPPDGTPDDDSPLRAVRAEQIIRLAVSRLNPPDDEALRISLSLKGEAFALRKLEQRRQEAARLYNVLPNTYRLKHEGAILFDLAFQIFAILIGADDQHCPHHNGACPDSGANQTLEAP